MKRTFYYQLAGELADNCYNRDPDLTWWPDQCREIEVDLRTANVILADPEVGPTADELLEAAAEAVCVAEYHRLRDSTRDHMRNDDDLVVYVSASRDVPGKRFKTTLYLEPSAIAYAREGKKPVRLPTAEELAEAAA